MTIIFRFLAAGSGQSLSLRKDSVAAVTRSTAEKCGETHCIDLSHQIRDLLAESGGMNSVEILTNARKHLCTSEHWNEGDRLACQLITNKINELISGWITTSSSLG